MRKFDGTRLAVLGCLGGLLLGCFGPVLFRGRQFSFRDAGYFYYPLYQRVQQEWDAGRWPLWEPEENAGTPLLANPTAAVLYPGKLLYAALPYPWAARLYIVGHVVLAFVAMRALLRHWALSQEASAFGGIAYAFGAPILFQYCNVVFLAGAAWTPLGFLAADRWIRSGRRWAVGELAVVLGLQTLAGDPEAAYLTVLCVLGYAVGFSWTEAGAGARAFLRLAIGGAVACVLPLAATLAGRSGGPEVLTRFLSALPLVTSVLAVVVAVVWTRRRNGSAARARVAGILGACALALALISAQLVPTLEYLARSSRAEQSAVDIYRYSLPPYRLVGAAWPNLSRSLLDGEDWIAELLPEGFGRLEAWVPSLYIGVLPLALGLGTVGLRGGGPGRVWLSVVLLLSLAAAFGEFGSPLFWARCVPRWATTLGAHDDPALVGFRPDPLPRDGAGSPYWLLTALLPGFRSFRYPSKLLTFACLSLAGLAAMGWDRAARRVPRGALLLAAGFLVLGLLGAAASTSPTGPLATALRRTLQAARPGVSSAGVPGWVARIRTDLLFGSVGWGLALLWLAGFARHPRLLAAAGLAAVSLDLGIANAPLVLTGPQASFDATPRALRVIEGAERSAPASGPFRIHRPLEWTPLGRSGGEDRGGWSDLDRWKRDTAEPIAAIPFGVSYVFTAGTNELRLYRYAMSGMILEPPPRLVREKRIGPGQKVLYHPRRWYDLWGTRYFVLPARMAWGDLYRDISTFLPETETIFPDPVGFRGPGGQARRAQWSVEEDWQVLRNRQAYPRAWVVRQVRYHPPVSALDERGLEALYREITYQGDPLWFEPERPVFDPRRVVWAEDDRRSELAPLLGRGGGPSTQRVRLVRADPQRVELDAELGLPGVVVLADVYYPGWRLTIDGRPAEILRVNLLMRGAAVPAGRHRLVYMYRPRSFQAGLGLTGLGLAALVGLGIWSRKRPAASFGVEGATAEPGRTPPGRPDEPLA